jgi:hypothetical protein
MIRHGIAGRSDPDTAPRVGCRTLGRHRMPPDIPSASGGNECHALLHGKFSFYPRSIIRYRHLFPKCRWQSIQESPAPGAKLAAFQHRGKSERGRSDSCKFRTNRNQILTGMRVGFVEEDMYEGAIHPGKHTRFNSISTMKPAIPSNMYNRRCMEEGSPP